VHRIPICDYLNNASGDGTFSVECWRTGLFTDAASNHQYFAIEQVLPPPSVREQVESKREAAKGKKYARNPQKKAFMSSLMEALRASGVKVERSQGESYRCRFKNNAWPEGTWVSLSIHGTAPALYFPKTLELKLDPPLADTTVKAHDAEYNVVSFDAVSTTTVPPPAPFVDAVKKVVSAIAVPAG